jgi:hypothetical protein
MPKKNLLIQCVLMMFVTMALLSTVPAAATHHQAAADAAKHVYICGCGPAAKCSMAADQPGNAPCGKPLLERQVLREDADAIYVCACADDCKCSLDPADPTRCACGKELRAYPKSADQRKPHAMPADHAKLCAHCPQKMDCAGCPRMPAAPQ